VLVGVEFGSKGGCGLAAQVGEFDHLRNSLDHLP